MNSVSNSVEAFSLEMAHLLETGDGPAVIAQKKAPGSKSSTVDEVAKDVYQASLASMAAMSFATGKADTAATSVIMLAPPPVNSMALPAAAAFSSVISAFSGARDEQLSLKEFKQMGMMQMITMLKELKFKMAENTAKTLADNIDVQLEVGLAKNLQKAKINQEINEQRAEQKDESLKGKIVKWIEPAITVVTAVVTIAVGVGKVLTGNPTGLTDITSGFCDLVAVGLRVAQQFDPDNEDLAKAAMTFECAAIGLGLVGGTAGLMKSLSKKAAQKILKKCAGEALAQGGKKLALKAAVEAGQKAMTQVAKEAAVASAKAVCDDVATIAADAFKQELADEVQAFVTKKLTRLARAPAGKWPKVAQKLLDAPKEVFEAIAKKFAELALKDFDAEVIKKVVSDQLLDTSKNLMQNGGKKGDELMKAISDGVNPPNRNQFLYALTGVELMATAVTHGTFLARNMLQKHHGDDIKALEDLELLLAQLDYLIDRLMKNIEKAHQQVGEEGKKMSEAQKRYALQSQQFNEMMTHAAS